MFELQELKGLEPTRTWQRRLPAKKEATANTAETLYFDLPRDHFIHELILQIGTSTSATEPASVTLADNIASLQIVGNGNKYLKDMLGTMNISVQRINGQRHITGIYHLFFSDPKIKEAKPLPAWVFTSLQLIITTIAGGATLYNWITATVVESAYKGEDLSDWKVLVEKYLAWKKYGTSTGEQLYEHERAYKIFTYLYTMDDNATLSATIYNYLKVLGRKPDGEVTIVDRVPVPVQVAENNARQIESLATGFFYLEWALGFPATEFSSLVSYVNIPTAGTNAGLRVLERYIL